MAVCIFCMAAAVAVRTVACGLEEAWSSAADLRWELGGRMLAFCECKGFF